MITTRITNNQPRTKKLCIALHGWQLAEHQYKNDLDYFNVADRFNGLPSTVRLKDFTPVIMTRQLQAWHFGLLKSAAHGTMTDAELQRAWASLWLDGRAFGDGSSWSNGYADYINHVNEDSEGMKLNPIVTSGAILEIVGNVVRIAGEDCYPIRTLNASQFDYSATWQSHPFQIFAATNALRDYSIDHFPQLRGLPVPVPVIQRASNVNWIPCDRVRVLEQAEALPPPVW